MNDKPLYDLLAKAELHPNSLKPLERLIWVCHNPYDASNIDLLIAAAAELEQFQQATEVQRDTEWLGEVTFTTEQIDEIREMFKNDDGTCKLSRLDVLRIVEKLEVIAETE